MTARKGKGRGRPDLRKLVRTVGIVLAAFGLPAAIGLSWRHQALQRWRRQREAEAEARDRESVEARLALQRRIAGLRAAFDRVRVASQPHYELLMALAKATPPDIVLRELVCDGAGFRLRGRVFERAGRPDSPLIQFCRDLAPPGAPWRFPNAPDVDGAEFAWRGLFLTEDAGPGNAGGPGASSGPAGAEPEDAARWEKITSAARSRLPSEREFDGETEELGRHWTVLARSSDRFPGLEVRHCALAYNQPTLGSWSDIANTVKAICAEPGVTLDGLDLAAAPDGGDAFNQAQIMLTARLRR